MPKSAADPFFGTTTEPMSAGRHALVPSLGVDLPTVSSSLIIACTTAGNVVVIMANDLDTMTTTIPIAPGTVQIQIQVRQIVSFSLGTGGGVVALWS